MPAVNSSAARDNRPKARTGRQVSVGACVGARAIARRVPQAKYFESWWTGRERRSMGGTATLFSRQGKRLYSAVVPLSTAGWPTRVGTPLDPNGAPIKAILAAMPFYGQGRHSWGRPI